MEFQLLDLVKISLVGVESFAAQRPQVDSGPKTVSKTDRKRTEEE